MSKAAMKFRDDVRRVDSLRPDPRNARTHDAAQIKHLAELIAAYGWTFPILIDDSGMIIAGHGRWRAAQLLRLEEIPVRVADNWSPEAQRLYVLADNKVAQEAGWDDEALVIELGELSELGVDLSLAGFDAGEIADLLGPSEAAVANAKTTKIDTSFVADVFWIQIEGPLAQQAVVLDRLQKIEHDYPAVTVKLGTTQRDAKS